MNMFLYLYTWMMTHLPQKDEGQDLTEYALLVALIAIVVVAAVVIFGGAISSWFASLGSKIPLS
jgi:pilus assembly protein Flp/PilA